MVLPSIHSNLNYAIIENVKEALEKVVSGWEPLGHCGNKCQYLKDLSTNKNMTHLKHQVEAILHPVVKSMVTSRYKSLTKIKVGAIRSRGDTSQEELMGSMHRDYHDEVNRRVPNKRPQSIIFAVDPFNFIYDQNSGGGRDTKNVINVPRGHAVIFTSARNHAGGNDIEHVPGMDSTVYLYRLFAYIVSDETDFPNSTIKLTEVCEVGKADDDSNLKIGGHTKKGRERGQTKILSYDEHGKLIR